MDSHGEIDYTASFTIPDMARSRPVPTPGTEEGAKGSCRPKGSKKKKDD
jgi:hypothetical protein